MYSSQPRTHLVDSKAVDANSEPGTPSRRGLETIRPSSATTINRSHPLPVFRPQLMSHPLYPSSSRHWLAFLNQTSVLRERAGLDETATRLEDGWGHGRGVYRFIMALVGGGNHASRRQDVEDVSRRPESTAYATHGSVISIHHRRL